MLLLAFVVLAAAPIDAAEPLSTVFADDFETGSCRPWMETDCELPTFRPIIDLRADVDRDGLLGADDEAGEHGWSAARGAIFLANIDDDELACPQSGSDPDLAACNDAANLVVNGAHDLLDLARLEVVAWPAAPDDATGTLVLSRPAAEHVLLFRRSGEGYEALPDGGILSAADLRSGLELRLEAQDVVRDTAVWDGFVDVTLRVDAGTGPRCPLPDGEDTVRLRVAPLVFPHHHHDVETVYATWLPVPGSLHFRADLERAMTSAGITAPLHRFAGINDRWTQDLFETASMAMPSVAGVHRIEVNVRSPNHTLGSARWGGRVVFTDLRGPDAAGIVQLDATHPDAMDSLNSTGNLETIPPHRVGSQHWPLGRLLIGSSSSLYPDPSFVTMLSSQGVQPPVFLDTSWLHVGHVDETISCFATEERPGWTALLAAPALARRMLQDAATAGHGDVEMFAEQYWPGQVPAAISISEVLADPDIMDASAWAAVHVAEQLSVLEQETGLDAGEVVRAPFLFFDAYGAAAALQPATVNGIWLSRSHYGAPDPHGPLIGGADIFKRQLTEALAPHAVTVHWIEDWDLYHTGLGEVHCASNTTRQAPVTETWWSMLP